MNQPKPGKESIQHFTDRAGRWVDYRYCHTDGRRFQKISRSLGACRDAKDKWIKKQGERL